MIWFFFFLSALVSLNSVLMYTMLKRAGLDNPELMGLSLTALITACVCYQLAIGGA